ncbi:MAG: VPLPA-CTERM sorting domain-containing protein [Mangrovicoccus sp.]
MITTDSWFTATFAGSNPFVTTPGTTVPLPAGLPLALTGLAGLVVLRRRA